MIRSPYVGLAAGLGLFIIGSLVFLYLYRRRRRKQEQYQILSLIPFKPQDDQLPTLREWGNSDDEEEDVVIAAP